MGPHHMDPPEALRAMRELGAARMVPIHFGTFINSVDEPGSVPTALRRAMTEHGVATDRVALLEVGEQRVLIARDRR